MLNPGDTTPPALAAQLADLPASLAPPTVAFRAEQAEPSDAILDEAEAVHATLVVVGARKRSSQGTFVMGTTTQRVLLDAAVPVLVVKAAYDLPDAN
ncbi:universal stress protein [Xylanimonas protaetiae]|uniref:universal stress protein n=1 Tax=Xylanimonas protaetiae TaxID=2509457 RepID=UPI001F5DF910|nr:universal stress protein [Xylanimonas protaetiae]